MISSKFIKIIFSFIAIGLLSFNLPKKLQKKVKKQIEKTFEAKEFELVSIEISEEINQKLKQKVSKENLFKITKNDELLGYAYVAKAPSKTDEFDYLILVNTELVVVNTKILIYREDYGGEIGSKRWLKQFIGKTFTDKLLYEKDVVAISGATISAVSMTNAMNIFLQDLQILHDHKVL